MKRPTKFDVYSKSNLVIPKSQIINGNLYVKGDLHFKNSATLKVYGNAIIDGSIFDGCLIVHGNLECSEFCNINAEVDENIHITGDADFLSLKSNHGQITIDGSASGIRLRALGGSVKVGDTADLTYIEAFDSIDVTENIIAKTITAGDGIRIGDTIINSSHSKLKVSIYKGGLHSKNINID